MKILLKLIIFTILSYSLFAMYKRDQKTHGQENYLKLVYQYSFLNKTIYRFRLNIANLESKKNTKAIKSIKKQIAEKQIAEKQKEKIKVKIYCSHLRNSKFKVIYH